MVSSKTEELKQQLRIRLGRFITTDSKRHHPHLYIALEKIRGTRKPAFLCGGAVRDLLLCNSHTPRDLDIILGYVSRETLASLFSGDVEGETGLGGLKVEVRDWSIDMWPLQDTWAFKKNKISGKGFSDYPKTTFLDMDAIAIELFSTRRQKRKIYSKGFFEAISSKTIELNFEGNPAPGKCIVRALQMARRFTFAIGPKLARYMVSYVRRMEIEELAQIYQRRYMSTRVTAEGLHNCMKIIETQLQTSSKSPVKVFAGQNGDFVERDSNLSKSNGNLFAMTE
ncbi:MAG: hypothetical protein HQ580_17725 [Planctomycetes bacterium]|nr:hypothetical protein [Planctomycetota bacterium]